MKVYTKVVIDMASLQIVGEDFYEYDGDVALCKSGGAGGGSPSGTVQYPEYLVAVHRDWLNKTGTDFILKSVVRSMSEAMEGESPYSGFKVVNVDDVFLGAHKYVSDYLGPYESLNDLRCLEPDDAYNTYVRDYNIDDNRIAKAIEAQRRLLTTELNTKVLPRFKQGMSDINAVQSSAFVIGEALIRSHLVSTLAKSDADIRLSRMNFTDEIALRRVNMAVEFRRIVTTLNAEIARVYSTLKSDSISTEAEVRARDRLFDLTVYQYGVNVMSAISGSAVSPPDPGPSRGGFMGGISGALSGAAMGALIPGAGLVGALAGAGLGFAAGYFS